MKVERLSNPLDSRAFLSIAQFWRTKERLCMNRVSIVVEYTLQVARIQFPTQAYNSQYQCGWYSGLSYDHRFINKRMLALENQLDERKQD